MSVWIVSASTREAYEFQMLLGVDPDLRKVILSQVTDCASTFPSARDWYPYSIRRLRENPSVAKHVMSAMFAGGS